MVGVSMITLVPFQALLSIAASGKAPNNKVEMSMSEITVARIA